MFFALQLCFFSELSFFVSVSSLLPHIAVTFHVMWSIFVMWRISWRINRRWTLMEFQHVAFSGQMGVCSCLANSVQVPLNMNVAVVYGV